MVTDPTMQPTLTPLQCLNGFRVDGHLWGQKGTNGYSYVLILPRMMQKCIPALRVISMAWSYSGGLHVLEFSHSLYCPGLEDKRKRDWVLLSTTRRTKKIKFLSFFFLSLGALIAYCNRSHPHSCNNQRSHSCHSRRIHSFAVHSHSSGCIPGSSSCCNLDSSFGPGLETTGEAFVKTRHHTRPKQLLSTNWSLKSNIDQNTNCWDTKKEFAYHHAPCHAPHIHGPHTAAAGRPLWAGQFLFHTGRNIQKQRRLAAVVTSNRVKASLYIQKTTRRCFYLASTDVVEFLLHDLLDRSLVFICDKYKSPPLLRLWILGQFDGLDLHSGIRCVRVVWILSILVLIRQTESMQQHTSPKVPKYSWITSFEVSGLRPPTKIFLTGSFFMAMAFLGSMTRPSSLCSFCSKT